MAMLVFFAGATGAGIVATDLLLIPHEGGVTLFGSGLFIGQLALCGGMGVSAGSGFGLLALLLFQGFHVTLLHLNTAQYADHVALEGFQHLGEQIERLALVLLLGVLLGLAAQMNALGR